MANNESTYLAHAKLNWLRGTNMPTAPVALYVGLFSTPITDAGSGTEVTTTVRTAGRLPVTFGAPASKSMTNSAIVDFGLSVGAASLASFGVFDAQSGGNYLGGNALTTPLSVSPGIDVEFPAGTLTWGP